MSIEDSPFLKACRLERTERIPVWYMRQAGRCLPEYRALKERHDILTLCRTPKLAAEISLMPVLRFGVDAAILFADIMLPLIAMGVDLDIVEKIGPVIKMPVRSMKGAAAMKNIRATKDLAYLGETINLIHGKLAKEGFAEKVPLIGFSAAPFTLASYLIEGKSSRDFAETKKMMHSDPRTWRLLMEKLTENIIVYLQYQAVSGVQAIQIFDSWAGNLSEQDYLTNVLPYSRMVFDALKPTKLPRIHFATNNAHFLREFASVDCEVIGIDWRTTLSEARKIIGPGKAIQGNLDPAVPLMDTEVIRKKADESLAGFDAHTGFIFNLGHGVLPETPYESLIFLTHYIHGK